jgi:hypothetical protein
MAGDDLTEATDDDYPQVMRDPNGTPLHDLIVSPTGERTYVMYCRLWPESEDSARGRSGVIKARVRR